MPIIIFKTEEQEEEEENSNLFSSGLLKTITRQGKRCAQTLNNVPYKLTAEGHIRQRGTPEVQLGEPELA